MQRLQDTDAFIMMEFADAARHLRDASDGVLRVGLQDLMPAYLERLEANGHSRRLAIDLLARAFVAIPKSVATAT